MKFCERLQYLREHYTRPPRSRYVTSELMGLGRDTLRKYERGEREPRVSELIKIADYYGLSLDELVNREKSFQNSPNWGNTEKKT